MKKNNAADNSGGEISRRKFLGLAASGTALSLLNTAPSWAGRAHDNAQYPVLTDYVGRLCYNENPLGPSPEAMTAISENLAMSHRYPDWYAESLRSDLAELHQVTRSLTIAGCGATEILRLCALAFVNPSGNVVAPNPSYGQFATDADYIGATVRYSPLTEDYCIDLDDMASRVDSDTKAVIITNPNNPTGTVLTATAIEDFVNSMPPQVAVIIDEAYHEYVDDPRYESAIQLVRNDKKVVVIRTLSKVYGLAGMRIGYAVGREELIQQMHGWQIYASVSRLSVEAAIAALADEVHVNASVALNQNAKQFCFNYFDTNELFYIPSQTNFFMLRTELSSSELAGQLSQRGISVRTGWGMENFVRVSTGTMPEMESFITALDDILDHVGLIESSRPVVTSLNGNYPNPFNSTTKISYSVTESGPVLIQIFNVRGQLVKTVVDEYKLPGKYTFAWHGRNQSGEPVASGSYFYRMTTKNYSNTRRMILIK